MNPFALILTLLISAVTTFATLPAHSQTTVPACGEKLRAAIAGEKVEITVKRSTYRLAGAALRHYRSEISTPSRSSDFEVYIESAAEYRTADGKITGFKISITDGGDESMVDYILDHRRKLVSAYWHNQSPMRFWFCEN